MSHHLYSNLYTWPWIFSTGNAKQIDLLPITQTIDYYEPNKIATELNSKSNKVYKLASLCEKNNFPIKDSHTSRGDTEGLINLNKHLIKMSPELFKESLKFVNRRDVQPFLKKEEYFTFTETWGGKTRQYTGTYIGEHCIYKGYHLVWDNRHDAEAIFSILVTLGLSFIINNLSVIRLSFEVNLYVTSLLTPNSMPPSLILGQEILIS